MDVQELRDNNTQGLVNKADDFWHTAELLNEVRVSAFKNANYDPITFKVESSEHNLMTLSRSITVEFFSRHLAIELYLKAFLVEKERVIYSNEHDLESLYTRAKQFGLEDKWGVVISRLNPINSIKGGIRYPRSGSYSLESDDNYELAVLRSNVLEILGNSTLVPTKAISKVSL